MAQAWEALKCPHGLRHFLLTGFFVIWKGE